MPSSASLRVQRFTKHHRSIRSPLSPAAAKSAQVPTFEPLTQTFNDFPGSPAVLPTHHSRPSRTPRGSRYSATSCARFSRARLISVMSAITTHLDLDRAVRFARGPHPLSRLYRLSGPRRGIPAARSCSLPAAAPRVRADNLRRNAAAGS